MPRKITNYDSLALDMEAVLNDENHKRIFEYRPNIKIASVQEEPKAPETHPVHKALEDIVAASTTLDQMGLSTSAAYTLKVADMILTEANPEKEPNWKDKWDDKKDKESEDKDEKKDEKKDDGKTDKAPADDKKMKAEERSNKALSVVQDLINKSEDPSLSQDYIRPTPDSKIEPIKVVQ